MKKIMNIIAALLLVMSLSSCYDRTVISDKGLSYFMPKPENVQYVKDEDHVVLTWDIPEEIPEEYRRPIAVTIQMIENNIYRDKITLNLEETSTAGIKDQSPFTLKADMTYRFIIKLVGTFQPDYQEKGRTLSVTSDGVIVDIE